jgi:hypothetical protein
MRKIVISPLLLFALLIFAAPAKATEPPVLLSAPTISGVKQIFEPQALNRGTWSNMSTGSYFQQWQRRVGKKWLDIPNALGLNYIANNYDVGRYLRAQVTAFNGYGNTTAYTKAYFIRGSGVSGVEVFPDVPGTVTMRKNGKVRMGRALCNEGLCRITKVRAHIFAQGKSYRVKVFYRKSKFVAGKKIKKMRFRVPRALRYSRPLRVRMRVRAQSTNRDVLVRVMKRNIN